MLYARAKLEERQTYSLPGTITGQIAVLKATFYPVLDHAIGKAATQNAHQQPGMVAVLGEGTEATLDVM